MKKVRLVAHQAWQKKLVTSLQEWGFVQLVDVKQQLKDSEFALEVDSGDIDLDLSAAAEAQARIKSAMEYLKRYNKKSEGLIAGFMNLKKQISREEMADIIQNYDGLAVASRFDRYEKRMAEIANLLSRLAGERSQLTPWLKLDLAPAQLNQLSVTDAVLGSIQNSQYQALLSKLSAATEQQVQVELIDQNNRDCLIVVLAARHDERVRQVLRESNFSPVILPRSDQAPTEAMTEIDSEIQMLRQERDEIAATSTQMLADKLKLEALYDYYGQRTQKYQIKKLIVSTDTVILLEGWLEEKHRVAFLQKMQEYYPEVVVFITEPEETDNPPIVLKNNSASTPFEFVMNMYGWPNYREQDPTAMLAPFFALFFAIALADAGYGILLLILGSYFMRKYDLDAGGKKFFRLFMTCGAVTVVVGLCLNGFFGNLLDLLPSLAFLRRIKNAFVLIDPMSNPIGMMILCVALGVVQVWTGYLMKSINAWRRGDKIGALLDGGPWMVWIATLTFFILTAAVPALSGLATIGKYAAIAGALGILLTQGRGSSNIFGKLGGGLYALYNTIGPLSDTLSYTRLLALGLSGGVIAMVVNTFAVMLKDIPFVGWILMLALLVFGHLFNIMLSLLGCFVHSARLQYVEFFTKFFEGGGSPFRPFRRETKYTVIKE